MVVYLLNTLMTPIDYSDPNTSAVVTFERITIDEAREILSKGFISVIDHEGTAQVLSHILDMEVQVNKINIYMNENDEGIHFVLKEGLSEGKILSAEELVQLDYLLVHSKVAYLYP